MASRRRSKLAQVYPEETLKLSFDAAPSLTGGATSAPATNAPAQVMFTLRPMKTAQPAGRTGDRPHPGCGLVLRNRRRSAACGPSLRDGIEQSRVGHFEDDRKRKIEAEGRNRVLSPALVFQAKVTMGTVETIAYGQKCRVTETAEQAAKTRPEPPASK